MIFFLGDIWRGWVPVYSILQQSTIVFIIAISYFLYYCFSINFRYGFQLNHTERLNAEREGVINFMFPGTVSRAYLVP